MHLFLEQRANERDPIEEIVIIPKHPMTPQEMLISACGWERIGGLKIALSCRDRILKEMSRSDI